MGARHPPAKKLRTLKALFCAVGEVPFHTVSLSKYSGKNEAKMHRYCRSRRLSKGIRSKICTELVLWAL